MIKNWLHPVVDRIPTEIAVKEKNSKRDGLALQSAKIIDGLIPVRDALGAVLHAQEANLTWQEARKARRLAYGRFVRSYGAINKTEIIPVNDGDSGKTRNIVTRGIRGQPRRHTVQKENLKSLQNDSNSTTSVAVKSL